MNGPFKIKQHDTRCWVTCCFILKSLFLYYEKKIIVCTLQLVSLAQHNDWKQGETASLALSRVKQIQQKPHQTCDKAFVVGSKVSNKKVHQQPRQFLHLTCVCRLEEGKYPAACSSATLQLFSRISGPFFLAYSKYVDDSST